MTVFKELTIAFGWLSGSLTGIGAVLYALGYLATRAHLYSLGIDATLLAFSNQYYLQRGAAFFLLSGTLLSHVVIALVILGAAVLALYALARAWDLRARLERRLPPFLARLAQAAWRPGVFALLVLVFAVRLVPALDLFSATLTISDRLYDDGTEPPPEAHGDLQTAIRTALRTSQSDVLEFHYLRLLVHEVTAALALALAHSVTTPWRYHLLAVTPFALMFLLHTLFLPMAYGVLMVPTSFNYVDFSDAGAAGAAAAEGPYLLLNRTGEEFVVWDPARKAVVWIPARQVRRATFTRGGTVTGEGAHGTGGAARSFPSNGS